MVARDRLGIEGLASEADLAAAVAWAGASVRFHAPIDDLPAHQIGKSIWMSEGLGRGEQRYMTAHELGHVELGHQLSFFTSPMTLYETREEHQADVFAGVFLFGYWVGPRFDETLQDAKDAGIPDEYLTRFLNAAGRPRPGV